MQPVQSHYFKERNMSIIGNSALEIILATLAQKDQGTQLSLDVNVPICETESFL